MALILFNGTKSTLHCTTLQKNAIRSIFNMESAAILNFFEVPRWTDELISNLVQVLHANRWHDQNINDLIYKESFFI